VSFSCYNCGKCRACDEYYRHRAEADVRNLARRRGLDIACMAHEQIVEAIWEMARVCNCFRQHGKHATWCGRKFGDYQPRGAPAR